MRLPLFKKRSYISEVAPACMVLMALYTISLASGGIGAALAPLVYLLLLLPTLFSLASILINQHRFGEPIRASLGNNWLWAHRLSSFGMAIGSVSAAVGAAMLISAAITVATGGLNIAILAGALAIITLGIAAILIGNTINHRIHRKLIDGVSTPLTPTVNTPTPGAPLPTPSTSITPRPTRVHAGARSDLTPALRRHRLASINDDEQAQETDPLLHHQCANPSTARARRTSPTSTAPYSPRLLAQTARVWGKPAAPRAASTATHAKAACCRLV